MDIARAIAQINPQSEYLLTNSNATSWKDIIEWYGPGKKPTPEQLETAWQEVLAIDAEEKAVIQKVVEVAKGAKGKEVSSLTTAERDALMGVLLFHAGALDKAGKVRPVQEWAGNNSLRNDNE